MGLLAYDPERVRSLQLRLRIAVDELRVIRCSDPTAVDTMRLIASIRSDIDLRWLPLIARILDNTALTRDWWFAKARVDNLQNSLINVMADGYGWTVQRDPLNDDATIVTPAEARAIGSALKSTDLESLVRDREQLHWLAQQLAIIGRDPTLSDNFLANFNSWQSVTYVLGREYAQDNLPDIASVFDGLMAIWSHTLPPGSLGVGKTATLATLLPTMERVDPYVQALMVRALRLDATTVATLTNELLTKWLTLKNDPSAPVTIDRQVGPGANAADILLPLLLADPAACVWLTQLAAEHPAILFETLNDPDLAYEVVLIGTDPLNTSTVAAGNAVLSILDYFRSDPYLRPGFDNDGHPGEYGAFLGELVAPWLLQFTMSNHDWSASAGEKAARLRVALHDEQAMQQLITDAERIRGGFIESLSANDIAAANQVGELLNLLFQLSVNERVDDELTINDGRLNLLWTVVGVGSSFLPGGPAVGIASGFALTALMNKVNEYLDQPDPSGVRRTAERTMDVALTVAGADAVARLWEQWIADGRLKPTHRPPPPVVVTGDDSMCPSAEYHQELEQWRRTLPGGTNGDLSDEARALFSAFVGSSEAQSNCAEIAG